MKNILLSAVALVGLTAGALAADLPIRTAPPAPAPIAVPPAFTWTGLYIGVNGGVAFQDENRRRGGRGGGRGGDDSSILGGGQIGYNMQFGMFVAGVEADIQAIDFERINTRLGGRNNGRNNDDEVDAFGTVRGRLGLAFFDRGLIYATGGLAYSDDTTGWVVGGGVEWALPVNWFGSSAVTFGLEGLWLSFDEDNDDDFDGVVGTFTPAGGGAAIPVVAPIGRDDENEFFVARAKLNFKFGTY